MWPRSTCELSALAYGFIASKVLFAALNAKLFDCLADGPHSLDELAATSGVAVHRLDRLITACVSVGLVERRQNGFLNASVSQQYLVSSSPHYFGDYFRFQIDRQLYPLLQNLDQALRGEADASLYAVMDDPTEAEHFSRAQHAGSLGPTAILKRMGDLSGATRQWRTIEPESCGVRRVRPTVESRTMSEAATPTDPSGPSPPDLAAEYYKALGYPFNRS